MPTPPDDGSAQAADAGEVEDVLHDHPAALPDRDARAPAGLVQQRTWIGGEETDEHLADDGCADRTEPPASLSDERLVEDVEPHRRGRQEARADVADPGLPQLARAQHRGADRVRQGL